MEGQDTNWRFVDVDSEIVLLNLVVTGGCGHAAANITSVQGDGCDMPYADDEFDICFSNSTIEHLHTRENQERFASEIRRVGRSYYVQTPARAFPLEPHWLGLFIHWLPRRVQRRVARWGTLYGLVGKPSQAQVDALIDEYRMLSKARAARVVPGRRCPRGAFPAPAEGVHRGQARPRGLRTSGSIRAGREPIVPAPPRSIESAGAANAVFVMLAPWSGRS